MQVWSIILFYKLFVVFCIVKIRYVLFHIVLSCDTLKDLWNVYIYIYIYKKKHSNERSSKEHTATNNLWRNLMHAATPLKRVKTYKN